MITLEDGQGLEIHIGDRSLIVEAAGTALVIRRYMPPGTLVSGGKRSRFVLVAYNEYEYNLSMETAKRRADERSRIKRT